MENKSKLTADLKALRNKKYDNSEQEKPGKPAEIKIEITETKKPEMPANDLNISPQRLQEAVIWSEILGKPLSKRRKRR